MMNQNSFAALKTLMISLKQLSREELIEGFVREAELSDPQVATTYVQRNAHVTSCCAHVSELARRNELALLIPLLDSPDSWIAFCAAERLSLYEGMEDLTLSTLDRIIALGRSAAVTKMAEMRRRNMRFG